LTESQGEALGSFLSPQEFRQEDQIYYKIVRFKGTWTEHYRNVTLPPLKHILFRLVRG